MTRDEFIKRYSEKMYIGDSVYVHFDGYHIILETNNGYPDDPRNRIGLEPSVFDNLEEYRKHIYEDADKIED